MQWLVIGITILGAVAILFAVALLINEKLGWNKRLLRFVGGLNVLVALFLLLMTITIVFGPRVLRDLFGPVSWSTSAFVIAIVLVVIWITFGLVPKSTKPGGGSSLLIGHILLLVASLPYGSVTFFLPMLIHSGLVTRQHAAVIPWLGFSIFPLSLLLWLAGFVLIYGSRPDSGLQPTPASGRR